MLQPKLEAARAGARREDAQLIMAQHAQLVNRAYGLREALAVRPKRQVVVECARTQRREAKDAREPQLGGGASGGAACRRRSASGACRVERRLVSLECAQRLARACARQLHNLRRTEGANEGLAAQTTLNGGGGRSDGGGGGAGRSGHGGSGGVGGSGGGVDRDDGSRRRVAAIGGGEVGSGLGDCDGSAPSMQSVSSLAFG
mmetsp:Transcript_24098/g.50549  ORF Transcript_24098/g.50549 Transcript_24098/m.50549 type:complete len:202 (+) Transcript_24098:1148-1753(+)